MLKLEKFFTLTIDFSEVWPRQIFDLGKQFNLMIRPENVLKTSLEDFLKTFWKRLEDVLKTYGKNEYIGLDQDALMTSSKDLCHNECLLRRFSDKVIKL